jgi:hypothetical protein
MDKHLYGRGLAKRRHLPGDAYVDRALQSVDDFICDSSGWRWNIAGARRGGREPCRLANVASSPSTWLRSARSASSAIIPVEQSPTVSRRTNCARFSLISPSIDGIAVGADRVQVAG